MLLSFVRGVDKHIQSFSDIIEGSTTWEFIELSYQKAYHVLLFNARGCCYIIDKKLT